MSLRFKCVILDHDDTAVDSTASIHYQAHVEVMRILRPDQEPISLDGWFLKNFDPGIMEYLIDELRFDEAEIEKEYQVWRDFTTSSTPRFFPGFIEALIKYRKRVRPWVWFPCLYRKKIYSIFRASCYFSRSIVKNVKNR